MSAHNLMTLFKRASLNVYDADIFNCSRQGRPVLVGNPKSLRYTPTVS
jgi:hypothetical protein